MPPSQRGSVRPKYYAWAALLGRTFAINVLARPDCGGRLRFLATIEERAALERILRDWGLPVDPPAPAPARQVDWRPGVDLATDGISD